MIKRKKKLSISNLLINNSKKRNTKEQWINNQSKNPTIHVSKVCHQMIKNLLIMENGNVKTVNELILLYFINTQID